MIDHSSNFQTAANVAELLTPIMGAMVIGFRWSTKNLVEKYVGPLMDKITDEITKLKERVAYLEGGKDARSKSDGGSNVSGNA
jgi:hypothetical protein